uniref:Uncharacterized protein n=1 Tax=Arundo donax TaxID=35708 RepID=A0A0A8XXD3_ARUDO
MCYMINFLYVTLVFKKKIALSKDKKASHFSVYLSSSIYSMEYCYYIHHIKWLSKYHSSLFLKSVTFLILFCEA